MQRKVLMLERSIRPNNLDTALWDTSSFAAEVYPDIPLLTSWKDVQKLSGSLTGAPTTSSSPATVPSPRREGQWLVHTMGVQTRRSPGQLQEALLAKAGVLDGNANGDMGIHHRQPDALLIVSGSHLLRRVPGVSGYVCLGLVFCLSLLCMALCPLFSHVFSNPTPTIPNTHTPPTQVV